VPMALANAIVPIDVPKSVFACIVSPSVFAGQVYPVGRCNISRARG
jgi:hypothetical protein